jgi:hypothetical protein
MGDVTVLFRSINEVIIFSAFISSGILFYRIMSYVLYERHL